MSVIGGVGQMAGAGVEGMIANPLRTLGRMADTGLKTWSAVGRSLAEGDLGGAARSYLEGLQEQGRNLERHVEGWGEAASRWTDGCQESASSGARALAQPFLAAGALAQNSLETAQAISDCPEEAADRYLAGLGQAGRVYCSQARAQVENLFG